MKKLLLSFKTITFSPTKLLNLTLLACSLCPANNVCAQSGYAGTYTGTYSGLVTKQIFCPAYSSATVQDIGTWTMTVGTDDSIQTSSVEDSQVDILNGYATTINWFYDPVNHYVNAGLFSQRFAGPLGSSQDIDLHGGVIATDGSVTGTMTVAWWNGANFCAYLDQSGQLQPITLLGSRSGTLIHPPFFNGETALGSAWYYLQFANSTPFGYYSYLSDPHYIYHIDLGFEYLFDANDASHSIYFYDFASSSFFYTSPTLFPDLYDFSLNAWLYYLPDFSNPGRYSHNPRWFFNFATGQWTTL